MVTVSPHSLAPSTHFTTDYRLPQDPTPPPHTHTLTRTDKCMHAHTHTYTCTQTHFYWCFFSFNENFFISYHFPQRHPPTIKPPPHTFANNRGAYTCSIVSNFISPESKSLVTSYTLIKTFQSKCLAS